MKGDSIQSFLVYTDHESVKNSTSAGVSHLLAQKFLNDHKDGIVYGCAMLDYTAVHIGTNAAEELSLFQGSKYVQSKMGSCYRSIREQLESGLSVLFTGTGCQIQGLRNLIQKEHDNLYCVEIVCHGVPSPAYFKEYMKVLEERYGGKIEDFKFRNKSNTDRLGYIETFKVGSKHYKRYSAEDAYYAAFIRGASLRPCCYECRFKDRQSFNGDICIGDSNSNRFHPYEAISLLIASNAKGASMIESIRNQIEMQEVDLDEEMKSNIQISQPTARPVERDRFYLNNVENADTGWVDINDGFRNRLIRRIKHIIPTRIKSMIKR